MEEAVIVHFQLIEGPFGSERERKAIADLADRLERLIAEQGVGEFDGEEVGEDRCVIYMYGQDADKLFAVVEPILRSVPMVRGGFAIKRYGEAGDISAREVRVRLDGAQARSPEE